MKLQINKQILIESILRLIGGILIVVPVLLIFELYLFDLIDSSQSSNEIDEKVIYVLLPTFFFMWCSISAAVSYIGGWQYLQKKYHSKQKISGIKSSGGSISISFGYLPPASYGSTLKIFITDNGLYMKSKLLFRFFHPPIFIPWEDIEKIKYKKRWLFKTLKVRVGKVKVGFYGKSSEKLNLILP